MVAWKHDFLSHSVLALQLRTVVQSQKTTKKRTFLLYNAQNRTKIV
ncbi:hypothetical protein NIES4071_24830 [Calothrix sp. NIES-4071]|nr:hypothetical protein NIES4071_24830 [Calothrix sp. NIES-4071]BAZ56806.1 hypothetical protein NIES4105_24770 [Calothrix sp. NIES-4105]